MNRSKSVPTMTLGRAVLIALMERYIGVLLDPFITLLEIHKLMYFMQEAGEPLRLKFVKGVYGPYADNLRHVLNAMEGHLVSGYVDGGDRPGKPIELVPGATEDAHGVLNTTKDTRDRLKRVFDLVEGFESSFGLELLATVHWVAKEGKVGDRDGIPELVYAWAAVSVSFFPEGRSGLRLKSCRRRVGFLPRRSFAVVLQYVRHRFYGGSDILLEGFHSYVPVSPNPSRKGPASSATSQNTISQP